MPDVMEEHRVDTPPPRAAEPARILDRLGLRRPLRTGKRNRILRYTLLGVVAVLGIVFGTRWLAMQAPAGAEKTEDLSLEAQWNKTIARLGIEPVFPPEEDLAVGDLFAAVVERDVSDTSGVKDKVDATPFLGKSVKLAHIDVRRDLEQAYALLPVFPDSTIPTVPADIAVNPAQVVPPPAPGLFMPGAQRKALPMAAFPGLTISHAGSAAAGVSGGVHSLFGFGSSREDTEKLILPLVETYGLPVVNANAVLQRYC
ncbi:MAG TPA: hypothetical protein VMV45_04420, partial [Casimicrobiaceae bacterium]|nr:hypothetical protein [Casimicrobiaceae bacterium]